MTKLEFTAKPYSAGPNSAWVFLDLPEDSARAFGARSRVSVKLTVGEKTFRVSAFPNGKGGHQLSLNKAIRAAAGYAPEKAVRVVIEPDTAPRTVMVPLDLK